MSQRGDNQEEEIKQNSRVSRDRVGIIEVIDRMDVGRWAMVMVTVDGEEYPTEFGSLKHWETGSVKPELRSA
jgi:hypothetical protein